MRKNSYYLLGVLALLLIVAYFVMQQPGEKSVSESDNGELVNVDSVKVNKIEIHSPHLSVRLEKRGDEWFVTSPVDYRADQSGVASLLHQAKNLQISNVISTNPEKHSVFMVDSLGTIVTMYQTGRPTASFIIGKMGTTYNEIYARRANSNTVDLIEGAMNYIFNRPVKEWRDKTIFKTQKDSIEEVKFQYGDTTFSLVSMGLPDKMTWMIGKDSTQSPIVNSFLSSLSNFQTDDFLDTIPPTMPKLTAQISCEGTELRFAFNKKENKYYVQTSDSPQWFIVEQWHANELLKRKKDFVKQKSK
jgi:Domain of unknown function (DUF4340)